MVARGLRQSGCSVFERVDWWGSKDEVEGSQKSSFVLDRGGIQTRVSEQTGMCLPSFAMLLEN
jgi:hypothetical protein